MERIVAAANPDHEGVVTMEERPPASERIVICVRTRILGTFPLVPRDAWSVRHSKSCQLSAQGRSCFVRSTIGVRTCLSGEVTLLAQEPNLEAQNPANCQLLHRKISRNSQLSQAGR
jgi:hypothetical protein